MRHVVSSFLFPSIRGFRPLLRAMTRTLAASAALAAFAACGDPLVTASYRGDPIFSVKGTVTQGALEAAPSLSQEVGVLWLRLVKEEGVTGTIGSEGYNTVLVEVTPADIIGDTLPANFDVSVLQPPSDSLLGTELYSHDENGSAYALVDRSRVAFGVVVVAPEGTFAQLPATASSNEFIWNSGNDPTGPFLNRFTYVSPFTVRYVKGASAEGLTIRDINGVESPLEDLSLFDIGAWVRSMEINDCRQQRLGEAWEAPEVQACIAEAGANNPDAPTLCVDAYNTARADEIDALCGVFDQNDGNFTNARLLGADEEPVLPLGENDARDALTAWGYFFIG